jgi:hypothetical protein
MSDTTCPVLIYQMGKVASSALVEALSGAGVPAAQTHFLGRQALVAILGRLLNPELDPHFYRHMKGQFDANLVLTRQLQAARTALEQGAERGRKVKVITLSREPLSWYRAEFLQNFAGYIQTIRRACGRSVDDGSADAACIAESLGKLFETLGRLRSQEFKGIPAGLQRMLSSALAEHGQTELLGNAQNLFKPVLWFQRLFEEPTGIDIFAQSPVTAGAGVLRFESHFCDALVVRYEDLQGALPAIAAFVGLPKLKLPRANVSAEKAEYTAGLRRLLTHRAARKPVGDAL